MKAMQCELCGGTEIVKDGDFFVCQSCGMKYTLENARKMMIEGVVEVTGTVKQDRSEDLARLLELSRNAIDACNYKDAESYAKSALEIDINNYKAWILKAEAIDWQMNLADTRGAEAAQAAAEGFKILKNKVDDPQEIPNAADVLYEHFGHLTRIVEAERNFITRQLETATNAKAQEYLDILVRHLNFRKTEYEAVQVTAQRFYDTGIKLLEQNGTPGHAPDELKKPLFKLSLIRKEVPEYIIDAPVSAALSLHKTASHKGCNAIDEYVREVNDLSKKARWISPSTCDNLANGIITRHSNALDVCCTIEELAIELFHGEAASEKLGKSGQNKILLCAYEAIVNYAEDCLEKASSYKRISFFSEGEKEARRKKIGAWKAEAEAIKKEASQPARDSHAPVN